MAHRGRGIRAPTPSGPLKPRQCLDRVELTEGLSERHSDCGAQRIAIDRFKEAAGKARGQLLHGVKLEALSSIDCGLGPVGTPSISIMDDDRLTQHSPQATTSSAPH